MPAKSPNRKDGNGKKKQGKPRKILRNFSCSDCGSSFMTSRDLQRHVRYRHTHEKPYRCKECNYASVESSKLKRHMRSHTGEKPYQCPHCSYASPDMFILNRHIRIHTGEKPYECDECQRRFSQSTTLKNHKLMMHSDNRPSFQCEICLKPLARLRELKLHIERMHNDKQHGETSSTGHSSHESNRILQSVKTATVKKKKDVRTVDIPIGPALLRTTTRNIPLTSTPEILRIKSFKSEPKGPDEQPDGEGEVGYYMEEENELQIDGDQQVEEEIETILGIPAISGS